MTGCLQHEISAGELEELTHQIRLMTDGVPVTFLTDGAIDFGAVQGRVAFQDGATEPEKTVSADLTIVSWSPTSITANMVGTENVAGARYFRIYNSADTYLGQIAVKT